MLSLETAFERLRQWVRDNQRALFWIVLIGALVWLMLAVKELTSLLIISYAIALLVDPLISRLERLHIPRAVSIISLGFFVTLGIVLLFIMIIPAMVEQYAVLMSNLPAYLAHSIVKFRGVATKLGVAIPADPAKLIAWLENYLSAFTVDHLKAFAGTLLGIFLRGYSFTLTILNLFLLPFFVFYLTRDLKHLHRFAARFIPDDIETNIGSVTGDILACVRVFFKGQMTVALILAVLYGTGLWLVGLTSGFVIGVLTGLLNVIPYFGLGVGVTLATLLTLVTNPSVTQFLLVWGVFAFVASLDGNFLTPKIIGDRMGIHPLIVMLALLIGGQLLGLLGLVIAIPAAASLRVVLSRWHRHAIAAS